MTMTSRTEWYPADTEGEVVMQKHIMAMEDVGWVVQSITVIVTTFAVVYHRES